MILRFAASVLCLIAGPCVAQTSADGTTYAAECNVHGAIMRPTSGSAPGLILGASCDAVAEGLGEGAWGSNADGFVAKFGETVFAFPEQDYPCGTESDPDPYFGLACEVPD